MADHKVFCGLSQPAGGLHLCFHIHGPEAELMAISRICTVPVDSNILVSKPQEYTRGNMCAWLEYPGENSHNPEAGIIRQISFSGAGAVLAVTITWGFEIKCLIFFKHRHIHTFYGYFSIQVYHELAPNPLPYSFITAESLASISMSWIHTQLSIYIKFRTRQWEKTCEFTFWVLLRLIQFPAASTSLQMTQFCSLYMNKTPSYIFTMISYFVLLAIET